MARRRFCCSRAPSKSCEPAASRFRSLPRRRILGEMTCLNYYPRSATVRAREAAEVFEVRRNLLFALQRVPESRQILSDVYRRHAIESLIRTADWFQNVSDGDRDAARQYLLAAWNQPRTTPDGVGHAQASRAGAACSRANHLSRRRARRRVLHHSHRPCEGLAGDRRRAHLLCGPPSNSIPRPRGRRYQSRRRSAELLRRDRLPGRLAGRSRTFFRPTSRPAANGHLHGASITSSWSASTRLFPRPARCDSRLEGGGP